MCFSAQTASNLMMIAICKVYSMALNAAQLELMIPPTNQLGSSAQIYRIRNDNPGSTPSLAVLFSSYKLVAIHLKFPGRHPSIGCPNVTFFHNSESVISFLTHMRTFIGGD